MLNPDDKISPESRPDDPSLIVLPPISEPVRFSIKATGQEAKDYNFASLRGPIKTTKYDTSGKFSSVGDTRLRQHLYRWCCGRKCEFLYCQWFIMILPDSQVELVIESIGHLVKSCLGGGIMGIHEAYRECGLMTALVLNVILGLLVGYCMHVLVYTAQIMYGRLQVPIMSYPDLAEAVLATGPFVKLRRFARPFRYAVDVTIGIDLFGSCCVYMVIISRTIKQLLEDSHLVTFIHMRVLIAALIIPCILICMITALKYLAPFSILADIFIVIVAIATVYYGSKAADKSPLEFPLFRTFGGFLTYLGVVVFSMEGVGVSLPIENHMAEPHKFPIVLFGGMGIVIGLVMTVGFFGYWGYGDKAIAPVTNNFPWATFPIILKVVMAIMIYITFALNFWVPFDLVWYYLRKRHPANKWWFWERLYRAIIVVIIVLIALIFPDVSSFMGFLGCFCLSLMGFILPAFLELCVIWDDPGLGRGKWRLVRAIVVIVFGLLLCIVGTYSNVESLIRAAATGH